MELEVVVELEAKASSQLRTFSQDATTRATREVVYLSFVCRTPSFEFQE